MELDRNEKHRNNLSKCSGKAVIFELNFPFSSQFSYAQTFLYILIILLIKRFMIKHVENTEAFNYELKLVAKAIT